MVTQFLVQWFGPLAQIEYAITVTAVPAYAVQVTCVPAIPCQEVLAHPTQGLCPAPPHAQWL